MPSLLLTLAAVIIGTKLLGELARRFRQPSVFGELLAGLILGSSVLALLDPRDPAIHALSQLGLFVLIFQIGLHTDLRLGRRASTPTLLAAGAGAVVPFGAGFFVARAFGMAPLAAVVAGASLVATSMAISARVLRDKHVLRAQEGQVVLGAALADDIVGLLVLGVVVAMVAGGNVSAIGVARVTAISAGFVVVVLVAGISGAAPLFRALDGIRAAGSLGMFGLAFGLLVAGAALAGGTAMIVGALVAGMAFHPTPQRHEIERTTSQIGHFFIPIFFATLGASVDLPALAQLSTFGVAAALIVAGILGKVVAGYAPLKFTGNKLLVGVALIPRGEIGLIFAQVGLSSGAITPRLFDAILLMVVVTTFAAAPLVSAVIRRDDSIEREEADGTTTGVGEVRRPTTVGRRH